MLLDMFRMPTELIVTVPNGTEVDVKAILDGIKPTIDFKMEAGFIEETTSFGFALVNPIASYDDLQGMAVNDPYSFAGLVWGWGDGAPRYQANALRKLAGVTYHWRHSSLEVKTREPEAPDGMRYVESETRKGSGEYEWGVFNKAGAVSVHCEALDRRIFAAVSGLPEGDDPFAADDMITTVKNELNLAEFFPKEYAARFARLYVRQAATG